MFIYLHDFFGVQYEYRLMLMQLKIQISLYFFYI